MGSETPCGNEKRKLAERNHSCMQGKYTVDSKNEKWSHSFSSHLGTQETDFCQIRPLPNLISNETQGYLQLSFTSYSTWDPFWLEKTGIGWSCPACPEGALPLSSVLLLNTWRSPYTALDHWLGHLGLYHQFKLMVSHQAMVFHITCHLRTCKWRCWGMNLVPSAWQAWMVCTPEL